MTSSITLRDYQLDALRSIWSEVREKNSALCVMSTGSGKTEVMIELVRLFLEKVPTAKIVVLVNRVTLLDQTYRRFSLPLGASEVGIFCGSKNEWDTSKRVTVASIQSIYDAPIDKINVIILDECHNVDQTSGKYFEFIESNKNKNPLLKIIGFTATPFRSKGYIYGEGMLFSDITFKRGLIEMINSGFLVKPVMKKVSHQFDVSKLHIRMGEFKSEEVESLTRDEEKVTEQIKDAIPRMVGRKKVVWACSSIEHCEMVNRILLSFFREDSVCLHSKMKTSERLEAQKNFEQGPSRHLVFVSIVSEGYDYPPIDCIVLMRPIRSPVLYTQTCGRGLRPFDGKENCLVLDYGQVVETCGPLNDPKVLTGKSLKSDMADLKKELTFCPNCLSYISVSERICPDCKFNLYKDKKQKNEEKEKPIDKLDDEASDGDILSYGVKNNSKPIVQERTMFVKNITITSYFSKNGNNCIVLNYFTDDYLGLVKEYFAYEKDFAMKNLITRLVELKIDPSPYKKIQDIVSAKVIRLPKSINVTVGKYTTVKKLNFV